MSDKKMLETVYRELLEETKETIKTVRKLMMSEDEDVQAFAVDAFLQLINLAAVLAEALEESLERIRNPLSRRVRLDR